MNLLEILEYLSLKDRKTCRLVSKKFKFLCDSIKINSKLVIFNRIPETKGKLKYTDEVYTLDDTIYVEDLGKFLKAHYRNLKNIKKLVIIGVNQEQINDFDIILDKLEHLELYSCKFSSIKIVESARLQNLCLVNSSFERPIRKFNVTSFKNATFSMKMFKFFPINFNENIKSIDYLELTDEINTTEILITFMCFAAVMKIKRIRFFGECFQMKTGLSNAIERIDCISNFNYDFDNSLGRPMSKDFLEKAKKKGVDVSISGIQINEAKMLSLDFFIEFSKRFEDSIIFNTTDLYVLKVSEAKLNELENYNLDDLTNFFKLVGFLYLFDLPMNKRIFERLVNVKSFLLDLSTENLKNLKKFKKILKFFPNLTLISIHQKPEISLKGRNLNLDPILNNGDLQYFNLLFFESIDLDVLLEIKKLKYLMLTCLKPIEYNFILNLCEILKYLSYFQILFMQPKKGYSKEELCKSISY